MVVAASQVSGADGGAASSVVTDAGQGAVVDAKSSSNSKMGRWATFKRLFRFAQPEHIRIGVGLLSLSVNSVTNLFFPWMMGSALDESSAAAFDLYGHITTSLGIISIGSIASLVRVYCLGTSAKLLQGRMRKQVFDGYIERDLHFFDASGIGEIVTVVESDVDSAAGAVTEKLAAGLRSMNSAINGSVLLFRSSPQLCSVALSATPIVGVLSMYLSKKSKRIAERLRTLQAAALSFAIERFGNVSTVRLNAQEDTEKARFSAYMDECYDLSRSNFFSEGVFMGFINLSTNFSLVLILIAGGRLISKGQLTAGALTRFAIQSAFVGLGFSGLSSFYSDMTKSLDAASRVFDIIDKNEARKLEVRGSDSNGDAVSNGDAGAVLVDDVSFAYPARPTHNALHGVTVSAAPRSVVALVGKSGCGKSTLLSLIAGLYDADAGSVRVGGATVHSKVRSADRKVGVVEQSSGLFSGSILENILYGRTDGCLDDAVRAARDANALEFIEALPEGFNTQLAANGGRLSGGQQARLALARALVRDPAVLLLDEPSAALDAESEAFLVDAIKRLRASKTIIVSTHSRQLMELADAVYVLADGKVVASGPFRAVEASLPAAALVA